MRELLIKRKEDETLFFLIENSEVVEYYKDKKENSILDGNIYIGKVQNIISGLEAAFVNLGEGRNAFIHKKDILPKKESFSNNDYDNILISKLIRPGMPILVEVKKDQMKEKGARVSTHISLRGRFVVLMPGADYITVSRKILNSEKRIDLKNFVQSILPNEFGAIIRTNAENVSYEEIEKDINNQLEKWNEIKNAEVSIFPKKVYDAGGILKKIIIDLVDYNLDKIIVDNNDVKDKILLIQKEIGSNVAIELRQIDLENLYNIKKDIDKLKLNKIWLKSGAFITIDSGEALTAIDVNTGKFVRKQ